jgi:hypothetical protein
MEFIAGVSVGLVIGLVAGLLVSDWLRRDVDARRSPVIPRQEMQTMGYLPSAPQAQPYPYQPPVIVLAAPRSKPNGVLRVEPPPRPLLRDDW